LLDHLPLSLHILLVTREDPPLLLSRLRGRGQLVEVRAADLRFTPQETHEFLNSAMGLDLSPDEIAALDRRTEGWIVGLQMAALSLQGQSDTDRRRFVSAFAGDDRYVADYLVDEVLRGQPPETQRFLVHTSILDRLCGPLCDAVLGEKPPSLGEQEPVTGQEGYLDRSASPSQEVLEHLLESNLFIVSLDPRRRWFRYHRLFAELLTSRLEGADRAQAVENHLRASAWCEREGYIDEAVSHAIEAAGLSQPADYARAAELVESYSGQIMQRGEFRQMRRWIDAIPEALVRERSLLCLARAGSLAFDSNAPPEDAVRWIERALDLSAANPSPLDDLVGRYRTDHDLIRENAVVFRVGYARAQHDLQQVLALSQEALDTLPEEAVFGRGLITFWLAQTYGQLGDPDAAERALERARQFGRAAEGHLIAFVVAGTQASQAWGTGDLHAVARICREAMASLVQPAEEAGRPEPYACTVYVYLGRTLVEWDELEEAEPLLVRGIELAERTGEWSLVVDACRDLAVLYSVQGHYADAHAWMDKALQACHEDPSWLEALRARIWLAQAEDDPRWLEAAICWAEGRPLEPSGEYDWELQTLFRVRIAQYRVHGEPDLAPILALLDERLAADPLGSSGWQVQNHAIKALLLDVLGRRDEAMAPLARALGIAQETGRVTVWLEHGPPMIELLRKAVRTDCLGAVGASHARRVVDAFEARGRTRRRRPAPGERPSIQAITTGGQAVLLDPLSERELEVLRLLATTLSGPEIADELVISLGTFRSHTKRIYSKLDVHSRLDAVARAQTLGLLLGDE
jgi:LuxR family maltose regulon positive regulatory protein